MQRNEPAAKRRRKGTRSLDSAKAELSFTPHISRALRNSPPAAVQTVGVSAQSASLTSRANPGCYCGGRQREMGKR